MFIKLESNTFSLLINTENLTGIKCDINTKALVFYSNDGLQPWNWGFDKESALKQAWADIQNGIEAGKKIVTVIND